ncbi:DUF2946 domain-containing protein [Trinickia caryophylli]|uniref:DUF2946 domain-containing protein n=1 Tax=Trinickia caryophylli TaxID=28094 RepID=A0A1X7DC34_TRICW|nr:DUF2946 domain-containing protein [Trinickia caryophylli]PMS09822.1 DUF2946 domain-containing protein [Trinickia caryophylli]TRX16800.1 DUF2946 domain-containing protein [Trinickia caryophylli]WQE12475.1 DUF2946 domain-containing protein [Trinickia caryophylli]SMF12629.1 Protein of unknown function [Trinickia caryophylli]GLU31376.1 hypothetical protein Busp01_12180 [Trinickia caryophylli]
MAGRFRKLTAWMGMLAVWLATVAPLVSQVRAQPAGAGAMVHGSGPPGGAGAVCGASPRAPRDGASHALHLDVCGYCSFFTHSPATSCAAPTFVFAHAAAILPAALPHPLALSLERYPHAYPRAPPKDA